MTNKEMTRPIKFRAWYQGKMIPAGSPKWLVEFDGDIWENVGKGYQPDVLNDRSDAVLMQFTGLTDKNGVEIYEGDIVDVEVTDTFQSICLMHWHNGTGGMHDAGWKFKRLDTPKFESVCCEDDLTVWYATVIGNVHQNPELVEATND